MRRLLHPVRPKHKVVDASMIRLRVKMLCRAGPGEGQGGGRPRPPKSRGALPGVRRSVIAVAQEAGT